MSARHAFRSRQEGVLLLEVMIAIVIFAIGVLSMIAVQAASVSAQADAQFRGEAERLVDRLVTAIRMEMSHDPTTGNIDPTAFSAYNHQTTGDPADCSFSGTAGSSLVTGWAADVRGVNAQGDPVPGTGLPGATAGRIQVVAAQVGGTNQLRITVCWQAPSDRRTRRHTVVAYVD